MTFVGTVKSFNGNKGYGFLDCPQTQQMYGKDMFLLKAAVPGGMVSVGDKLSFEVVMENNGPVARNIQILSRAAASTPSFPGYPAYPTYPSYPSYPSGASMAASAAMASSMAGAGSTHTGTVKSFSEQNGWGLIDCAATQLMYGKDVFFGKSVLPGGTIKPGTPVSFVLKIEEKGPAALSLEIIGEAPSNGGFKGQGQLMAVPQQLMGYAPQNWDGRHEPNGRFGLGHGRADEYASAWPWRQGQQDSEPSTDLLRQAEDLP